MRSIETISAKQIVLFVLCLLLTFLSIGASAFVLYNQLSIWPEPKTNSLLCAQRLRLDGFNIDSKELELRVTNNDLSLIENAVLKAGLAMPVCYEYELVEFCAGNQCDEPGVSFLLRKQN